MKTYNNHRYNSKVGADADRETINDSAPPVIPNYDNTLDEKTQKVADEARKKLKE